MTVANVAGVPLGARLGQAGPPLVGTVRAALALVSLTVLALMRATRSDAPLPSPGTAADQSVEASHQGMA
jgi:predicted MFS family arabinose efflux permease